MADEDKERSWEPTMGKVELLGDELENEEGVDEDDDEDEVDEDEDVDDEEDGTNEGSIIGDGAGGGEGNAGISSALVPEPSRYSFPRHLIVDEPVNA